MAAQRVFWIQTPGVGDDGKIVRDLFSAYGQDAEMYKDPNQPSKWIVSTPRAGQSGVLPPRYTVIPSLARLAVVSRQGDVTSEETF